MNDGIDVRIRLAPEIHKKWLFAANLRGLTLTAYITATVSGELIRTGELSVTPVTAAEPPLKAASSPAPARKSPPAKNPWLDDEEEKPKPVAKPSSPDSFKAAVNDWVDDDEDGEEDDLSQYDDK